MIRTWRFRQNRLPCDHAMDNLRHPADPGAGRFVHGGDR
jgi:hypothetical protein